MKKEKSTPDPEQMTQEEHDVLVEMQTELISEQATEIASLKARIERLENSVPATKPAPRLGSFTRDGQQYAILHGLQVHQEETNTLRTVTVADIEQDTDLQDYLLGIGSGAIQPIL